MTPEQQSPIVLTSMTLRGIGSYLDGARLDLKPLTVLCGENGSGKSTWLNALNLLKRSFDADLLPFAFDSEYSIPFTNDLYQVLSPAELEKLRNPKATEQYGPPQTIGLDLIVVRDHDLAPQTNSSRSNGTLPQELFWAGRCRAGTPLQLRLAHPSFWSSTLPTPDLTHFVELKIGDCSVVRMSGERDPKQSFDLRSRRIHRTKPYDLYCSPDLIDDVSSDGSSLVHVARVFDLVDMHCEPMATKVTASSSTNMVKVFEQLLRELLAAVLHGYFYIGAIRRPHTSLSLSSEDQTADADAAAILTRRHVGKEGEYAWLLEDSFSASEMRRVKLDSFVPAEMYRVSHFLTSEGRGQDGRLGLIWDLAARDHSERAAPDTEDEEAQVVADILNSVLDRRELAQSDVWAWRDEHGNVINDPRIDDAEIRYLCERGVHNLSLKDVRRLNFLLIEHAFIWEYGNSWTLSGDEPALKSYSSYAFLAYLSVWTRALTDVGITQAGMVIHRGTDRTPLLYNWPNYELKNPSGLLLHPSQPERFNPVGTEIQMVRAEHPCFGTEQAPRQFSAGFHQVFRLFRIERAPVGW